MTMDEESTQIREVYARYGLAVYLAQVLETEAWLALSLIEHGDPSLVSRWRLEEIQEEMAAWTLGQVVARLNRSGSVSFPLGQMLIEAVKTRNWLAHRYFWDRCVELHEVRGRELMIVELNEIGVSFQELDRLLADLRCRIMQQRGISVTEAAIESALTDLLSRPSTPISARRRLNKTEKIVRVYSHGCVDTDTGTPCRVLLFELSDGRFCSLCECGLTYGPDAIDPGSLSPLDEFADLLPAEVIMKPKGTSNWHYRIALGTAAEICVEPVQQVGCTTHRWYIRKCSG